jgi:hypothetical protein
MVHQKSQTSEHKAEELSGIVELIGKQYLRWVLSPGMHVSALLPLILLNLGNKMCFDRSTFVYRAS